MSGKPTTPTPSEPVEAASAPCQVSEAGPDWTGLDRPPEGADWSEIAAWRKAQRRRLFAFREGLKGADRADRSRRIAERLTAQIDDWTPHMIAVYWPLKGEPDMTGWMRRMVESGARVALPVVIEKKHPLIFREWRPGIRMVPGIWNIPVPAEGPSVIPTVAVAPLVGFDENLYRLGHGGGYYDRTLAAAQPRPLAIGVGFALGRLETIHPQPHDIPMDAIVTEDEFRWCGRRSLNP